MRASIFFGKSEPGTDACAFCGLRIRGELAKNDYIKDTFTDFGDLAVPGSPYICAGCAASLGNCAQPLRMIDGSEKVDKPGAGRALANRWFSWACHGDTALAATKAHIRELREFIINAPVGEECAVVLSDSGQKHCLFKAPTFVSDGVNAIVRLEDETISVNIPTMAAWLSITDAMSAVIGKPALLDKPSMTMISAMLDTGLPESDIMLWFSTIQNTPLGRLVGWLTRPKDGWK